MNLNWSIKLRKIAKKKYFNSQMKFKPKFFKTEND